MAIRYVLRVDQVLYFTTSARVCFCFAVSLLKIPAPLEIMTKAPCVFLLLAALCSPSAAVVPSDVFDVSENVLQVDGFAREEIKESNLNTKCYDEETKTAYKVDSVWYTEGKCEKRTCSRQKNSKTPIIKTMECEPCTTCNLPNHACQPFRPEKNYPKCCPKCLSKSTILKKTDSTKKYKTY